MWPLAAQFAASASTATGVPATWWEYVLLFLAVAASWAGVPAIDRWGAQILARPGKKQAGRQKLLDKGERAYAKWGRMAVFFTPAIISGTAKMKRRQFAVWNQIASLAFTISVAATAYGIGRVATGHHSKTDILILVVGLAVGVVLVYVFVRRHRRHKTLTLGPPPVSSV